MLLGATLKAEYLRITNSVWGLLKAEYLLMFYFRNKFFTKIEETLRAEKLQGDPWEGGGRGKCLARFPLNTPLLVTLRV